MEGQPGFSWGAKKSWPGADVAAAAERAHDPLVVVGDATRSGVGGEGGGKATDVHTDARTGAQPAVVAPPIWVARSHGEGAQTRRGRIDGAQEGEAPGGATTCAGAGAEVSRRDGGGIPIHRWWGRGAVLSRAAKEEKRRGGRKKVALRNAARREEVSVTHRRGP